MIKNKAKPQKKIQDKKKNIVKYWFGTGRRKSAIAQVRIFKGRGKILLNQKKLEEYFHSKFATSSLKEIFILVGQKNKFDVTIRVSGGGIQSQKEAIKLGIARALVQYDNGLRTTLKKSHLLTRDPREKERKKYGLKGARRAPQWQKR